MENEPRPRCRVNFNVSEWRPAVTELQGILTARHSWPAQVLSLQPLPLPCPTHNPPRNRALKRAKTKHWLLWVVNHPPRLFMVRWSPDILHSYPSEGYCILATVSCSPRPCAIPLVLWTSRQIAAACFFFSPAGIVQNCDIVGPGEVVVEDSEGVLEAHTRHSMRLFGLLIHDSADRVSF